MQLTSEEISQIENLQKQNEQVLKLKGIPDCDSPPEISVIERDNVIYAEAQHNYKSTIFCQFQKVEEIIPKI